MSVRKEKHHLSTRCSTRRKGSWLPTSSRESGEFRLEVTLAMASGIFKVNHSIEEIGDNL